MAYNPGIEYRGDQYAFKGITGAGNALVDLVHQNQQDQMDSAQADALVAEAVRSGAMTPEEHTDYIRAPLQKKKGIVGALTINWAHKMQEQQRQLQERQAESIIKYHEAQTRALGENAKPFVPYGTTVKNEITGKPIAVWVNSPNSALAIKTAEDDEDSWAKLNKDVKSISGFNLGDWQRAEKKRIDPQTNEFIAELPPTKGYTDPQSGITYGGGPPKVLRIPGSTYQDLLSRFNGLAKTQPNAMPIPDLPAAPQSNGASPPTAGATGTVDLKALAQKALNDPAATAEQKAAARKILGQ